jgi:hypothetical protein
MITIDTDTSTLSGKSRRLLHEWKRMEELIGNNPHISYTVTKRNDDGLPVGYSVKYAMRSICGVENEQSLNDDSVANPPIFADEFIMEIAIPREFPCVDAMPAFRFLTTDEEGRETNHPWHPNIRYYGAMAGRVCLNQQDTYTDIAWSVVRIAEYLSYSRYHAVNEPPYPEDHRVAQWVVKQGEPSKWIFFD